jgi:hypothetical protein
MNPPKDLGCSDTASDARKPSIYQSHESTGQYINKRKFYGENHDMTYPQASAAPGLTVEEKDGDRSSSEKLS